MSVLTPDRSGIARSGATRSGYPVPQGAVLPLYALSGVARSGATRSNYTDSRMYVTVGGVQVGIDLGSLTLSAGINHTPTTGQFTAKSFAPVQGQQVIVTFGSINNLDPDFYGYIVGRDIAVLEVNKNPIYTAHLIDSTWRLKKRKVTAQFTNTSVATIAAYLLSYATGFSLVVSSDIGAVILDSFSFTLQDIPSTLTQLTKRVGGDWKCVKKVVSLYFSDTDSSPMTVVNAISFTLCKGSLALNYDLSQIVTRVLSEGGGTNALTDIAVGETIIPVEDAAWYPLPSTINDGTYVTRRGFVRCGNQTIQYGGVLLGGGGGLVGPGASPSAAPLATGQVGTGVETGLHYYAITFLTGSGESIAGPTVPLTVGTLAAPTTAPLGSVSAGGSVDAGDHRYAVTYVTATGETTPGPNSATVTTGGAASSPPSSAPSPGTPTVGGNIQGGLHSYGVTFVTGSGETGVSASSAPALATNSPGAPTGSFGFSQDNSGTELSGGYIYTFTFLTSYGETTAGGNITTGVFPPCRINISIPLGPAGVTGRNIYRTLTGANGAGPKYFVATINNNSATSYLDSTANISANPNPPVTDTSYVGIIPLTSIPTGPAGTTARKLYRTFSGGSQLKLLATLNDNTTTGYTDNISDVSLGANAPTGGATLNTVPLTQIPVGPTGTTSRKVYRTPVGSGQLKLLTTIADNTTTTFSDTAADASLGTNAPASNTAVAQQVALTAIPVGGVSVTGRKVYRSKSGLTQLQLLTTLGDNTTTTYTDTTSDAALGVNAPIADTSGLTQPSGQLVPGATAIPVAGISGFSGTGGWAAIGNGQQVVRYTGITANSLTGVPTSGPGSLTATVSYGATVTSAAMLTGIPNNGSGSILYPITKGDQVNLLVIVDATLSQANLITLIDDPDEDGIQEVSLQDGSLGDVECVAQAKANLELTDDVLLTATFSTYDRTARPGRLVPFNIGPPYNLFGNVELLVQKVDLMVGENTTAVERRVVASALRFTLDDLLRLIKTN